LPHQLAGWRWEGGVSIEDEPLVLGAIGEAAAHRAPPQYGANASATAARPGLSTGKGEAASDDSDELAISSLCWFVLRSPTAAAAAPAALLPLTRSGGPRPEAAALCGCCRLGGEGDSLELS
jgi:hypothetical protein